ncbi:LLM class flavin-dependent oxidoreductase [Amycolatopsis thermoflava]|uniref:LLM class flavin-dependent oxidoreductase n=1 Tax=Amycolatopsis thermoflava TaxID=84480 RepID=UPI00382186D6
MHLSVFQGPVSTGAATDLPLIELCLDHARRCADEGFAMVTFSEQHFNGYEPSTNPFLMAARLSPHLGETYFGTTIVPLVFHDPRRVAEDSNIVDLLLRGRFVMGMSAGRAGFTPDFDTFGLDATRRQEIFATKLDLLQRIRNRRAGDEPVTFDTGWDRGAVGGRMMPLSYRRDGAQVAVGTNSPKTVLETAERGWPVFLGPCRAEVAADLLARHRKTLEDAGHSPEVIDDAGRKSLVTRHVFVGATDDEAWEMAERMAGRNPMMDRTQDTRSLRELAAADPEGDPHRRNVDHVASWMLAGSPDRIVEQIHHYDRLGVRHLNVRFTVGPYQPDLYHRSFELFVREVLPHVNSELFPALGAGHINPEHLEG